MMVDLPGAAAGAAGAAGAADGTIMTPPNGARGMWRWTPVVYSGWVQGQSDDGLMKLSASLSHHSPWWPTAPQIL
jgi:hypothetical protein